VIRREAHKHLEDLPGWCNTVIGDALSELTQLDACISEYDKHIAHLAQEDEQAKQLMRLRGIWPTTASAIAATIGKDHDFTSGRQFCAWLGLVSSQYSSGGKSVLAAAKNETDPLNRWAISVQERRGYGKAMVPIADKRNLEVRAFMVETR
jgi:transposase